MVRLRFPANPALRNAQRARIGRLLSLCLLVAVLGCDPREPEAADPPTEQPQFDQATVFSAGEGGYHCFRIPALIVTPKGTVLAFSEARESSCRDDADIDLVMKRSLDAGTSWGKLEVLLDDGDLSVNQPAPILDHITGEVILVFCKNNQRVFATRSSDDGVSWTPPTEITHEVKDPAWSYIGAGPGHGIQLASGRLLVPGWGDTSPGPKTWRPANWGKVQFSYVMYSDDHGRTWHRGDPLDINLSDESTVVETADGSIYMNMRSRRNKRMRAYAWSNDAGLTWSRVEFDERLPEPSVQGSVIRFTDAKEHGKNRVLLVHPSSQTERSKLTVRLSYDECRTWPVAKVIHAGSAAYSDLAIGPGKTVLCLYEAEEYSKLVLARFNLAWLTDGADRF